MTLAQRLKKLRKKNAMSMSQVARLSELSTDQRGRITQGYISRLESGKETNPSLQKLLTICSIYHVDPNELFKGSSSKKSPKHPFTTKTVRQSTQGTEMGIRRIAETLAKSPRYLAPIENLLKHAEGRRILSIFSTIPEKLQENFFGQIITKVKVYDLNNVSNDKIPPQE